jgi:methionyl-tRNA formyltransferase
MLRALLDTGLEPLALIEERSAVADEERHKFEVRMAGLELAPSFDVLLAGREIERCLVPNHNSDACQAQLERLRPELLVLGGTRILRKRIFERAAHTLNAHPGLLPELRGSASVAWAIATDLEVGCTCHFIDAGIDTGPIVSRERIPVHRGDTYELLCWKTARVSARLMAKAVRDYFAGTISATPQGPGGTTYRNMPEESVAEVKRKLAEGRYAHYVN